MQPCNYKVTYVLIFKIVGRMYYFKFKKWPKDTQQTASEQVWQLEPWHSKTVQLMIKECVKLGYLVPIKIITCMPKYHHIASSSIISSKDAYMF